MYLQITTRCNMHCAHCCYSCTSKGTDMKPEVYRKAIETIGDYDGIISIGGGEPTLHPNFWEIIGLSIAHAFEGVWLATNGSQTKTVIALAKMAKSGVISCELSRDTYHEAIDSKVYDAFNNLKRYNQTSDDRRGIRSVNTIIAAGRGKNISGSVNDCPCEEVFIKPNGDAYMCGCKDAPRLGSILNPEKLFDTINEYRDLDITCWNKRTPEDQSVIEKLLVPTFA